MNSITYFISLKPCSHYATIARRKDLAYAFLKLFELAIVASQGVFTLHDIYIDIYSLRRDRKELAICPIFIVAVEIQSCSVNTKSLLAQGLAIESQGLAIQSQGLAI